MGDSPWILNLRHLLAKHQAAKLAEMLSEENMNVISLVIALCPQEKRKELFLSFPKPRRLEIAKILPSLKYPPDFVLQTIFDSLSKKLASSTFKLIKNHEK